MIEGLPRKFLSRICSKGPPLYSEVITISSFIPLNQLAFLYIYFIRKISKNFVRCLIITPAEYGHLQVPASTALMAYERKNKYYNLTCSFNLSRILTFHFLFQGRFICAYNHVFYLFIYYLLFFFSVQFLNRLGKVQKKKVTQNGVNRQACTSFFFLTLSDVIDFVSNERTQR